MGRSRSKSRDRRKRSRSRDERRERRYRKEKRRHHKDSIGSDISGDNIESLLKRDKKKNDLNCDSPSTSVAGIGMELGNGGKFDATLLSEGAKEWLDARVTEQVSSRVADLESIIQDRVSKARSELEGRLRIRIEQEMIHELEMSKKREEESRKKCAELEEILTRKIKDLEEAERKLKEERLSMLQTKSQLEIERNHLKLEKESLSKNEQQAILNKGGSLRPPIKIKFGSK